MISILVFALWLLCATVLGAASYNPTRRNNIAVYWGQNSAGGANTQAPLVQVCRDQPEVDIILLAFLTSATNIDGGINFANSYRPTQQEIIECQSKHNKIILLSLAGQITDGTWSFPDASHAIGAANSIWEAYGPPSGGSTVRPFGQASVDGFDLDIEAPYAYIDVFAQQLRKLMNEAMKGVQQKLYLAAAPQCPFPDENLNAVLFADMAQDLDMIFVQFYNNEKCDMRNKEGFKGSLEAWHSQWATKSGAKMFLGVPGAQTAVSPEQGASYKEGSVVASEYLGMALEHPSFAGVMVWDMSQLQSNAAFLPPIIEALNRATPSNVSDVNNAARVEEQKSGGKIQTPRRHWYRKRKRKLI